MAKFSEVVAVAWSNIDLCAPHSPSDSHVLVLASAVATVGIKIDVSVGLVLGASDLMVLAPLCAVATVVTNSCVAVLASPVAPPCVVAGSPRPWLHHV